MTAEITKLNTLTLTQKSAPDEGLNYYVPDLQDDNYFLSITSRFSPLNCALMKVEKYTAEDVINGNTAAETERLQNEADKINNLITTNTQNTLNSIVSESLNATAAKSIGFVSYSSSNSIKAKTDTTNILKNIQYANSAEKEIVEGAITVMTEWLDDYITNYDSKIAEGVARGDSELKRSFLLEIRKAIENVDFPIGFGDYSDPEDEYTLGSYAFNLGGYDQYYHLNTNRSILLNAKYLMPARNYTSYQEIIDDINAGQTNFYYLDIVFASDEGYLNYCKNYMASVLVHELTHSLHIYNEAVTYFTNDCFDDDFYNQAIDGVDQNFMNNYFGNHVITYGDLGISHELDGFEAAVQHGHSKNMDYQGLYVNKGFTITDDRNELLNFAYNA